MTQPPQGDAGTPVANGSILVIDDDPHHLRAMEKLFSRKGWQVTGASSPWEGIRAYIEERTDVVLLDLHMPGLSGMRILELLRERDADATILMLTGQGQIAEAVEAMRLGAENFLAKPANPAHLLACAERAREKAVLRHRHRTLIAHAARPTDDAAAMGTSAAIRKVTSQLAPVTASALPVLLTGETGTGKSMGARYLHDSSPRAGKPFVEINCAGLSATFLDSELFGHERGAFTDAKAQRIGLFELADGGTLFLDEIGDLAVELQPKLLRVLETQRFRRLGGTREIQVDVRLVAATHRDLAAAVADGRFREDLFYRLAVYPVRMPALRERGPEDIEFLALRLLRDAYLRFGAVVPQIEARVITILTSYSWPGNIRELRNVIERMALMARHSDMITSAHVPAELCAASPHLDVVDTGDLTLATAEKRHIERVMAHYGNHRSRAAGALGISRSTLYAKLAAFDVQDDAVQN